MIRFDEETHRYWAEDGSALPSVTEICRFLSYDTAVNAKPWLRDAAADRGSRVHAWCMLYDYGALDLADVETDALPYVQAYIGFCRDFSPDWELIEHPMGSAGIGFAGTLDRYGVIDGARTLMDLKTTATLRKAPLSAQLAGYGLLLRGEDRSVDRFCGLHLDKHGCYALTDVEPDLDAWIACRYLHEKLKKKRRSQT